MFFSICIFSLLISIRFLHKSVFFIPVYSSIHIFLCSMLVSFIGCDLPINKAIEIGRMTKSIK